MLKGSLLSNRTRASRLRRIFFSGCVALAMALTPVVVAETPAEAAPVSGFEAGNIISDSLFYDGNAMNSSEIQVFLNQRLSSCKIGTPPYMPGAPSPSGSGNIIASNCLKDFRQTTSSQPADQYCAAYAGASNETSAQIIAKVGQACGVSQKALLVMLEKEQSLLTDDWPVTRQYNYALGMDCPDSGPNGSANCDAASAGFSVQLYRGARQLKRYGLDSYFSWFPVGGVSNIQYHPSTVCGTKPVTIRNKATAALYYYTPYTPNQAALNAGWGTGDSCSSYGNRNFYNFYKDWFGPPNVPSYAVTGSFKTYWDQNASWLGAAVSAERTIASRGGGKLQDFAGGFLYERNGGITVGITRTSPVLKAFAANGGIEGRWGWPVGAWSGGTMQFELGLVVEASGKAALIPSVLVSYWQGSGGIGGSLGAPVAEATTTNGLWLQDFASGTVVRGADGAARVFDSRFLAAWKKSGGLMSPWGTPKSVVTSVTNSNNGNGLVYPMSATTLYQSSHGTFSLPAGNLEAGYQQNGGPAGSWGWPRGRQLCADDGSYCSMDFSRGVATWTDTWGVLFTPLTAAPPEVPTEPGNGETITGGAV